MMQRKRLNDQSQQVTDNETVIKKTKTTTSSSGGDAPSKPEAIEAPGPSEGPSTPGSRLTRDFFTKPCVALARSLLGKRLVRQVRGVRLSARIVETEAYLGFEDKAAHSYLGRKTPRNQAMFMEPGTCYVYNIYGYYCCFNISSQGEGAAVLLRALDVTEGMDAMKAARLALSKNPMPVSNKVVANGPSKLCMAMMITKPDFNQQDVTSSNDLWLEDDLDIDISQIVASPRIGLGPTAGDWADKLLRFYVLGNPCVSKRNKQCEAFCF